MRPGRLVIPLLLCAGALAGCAQHVAQAPPPGVPEVIVASPIAPTAAYEPPYLLDSGDRLRIQVFGQEGLSNSYTVDAGGNVNFALIGPVPARGRSPGELAHAIAARLRQGYIRAPHVTAEIEAYRPFFILGEVTAPGQYPYVANMTAETAIAIAGGYAPRARKSTVELTRTQAGQITRATVPAETPIRPGDTITVAERWF
jgi:polysaccharide export outer membrane protein